MTTAQQVARALQATGPNRKGWWAAKCVYHEDLKPSLNFSDIGFNCFGCEAHGHINKLAEDLGIRERKNFTMKKDKDIPAPRLSELDAMDALEVDRHLRPETISMFGIRADTTRQKYVYPDPAWPEGTQRLKAFNGSSPKYLWHGYDEDEAGLGLYGLAQALTISSANGEQRVTLVEGEPDVWTMAQAGLAAVSFTKGAQTVPDGAVEILAGSGFTHVDVVYDLDAAGLEGGRKAAAALESKGMTVRVLSLPETLGEKGDVSDMYAHVGADDCKRRRSLRVFYSAAGPGRRSGSDGCERLHGSTSCRVGSNEGQVVGSTHRGWGATGSSDDTGFTPVYLFRGQHERRDASVSCRLDRKRQSRPCAYCGGRRSFLDHR